MNESTRRSRIFDPNVAAPARVYDFYLGGKDNYPADRRVGEKVLKVFPQAPRHARANRKFLTRAVRHCARAGIGQFIDLGAGIPARPNVADTARAVNPRARMIGVDNDPVVLTHQRAEASCSSGCHVIIEGDVRRPRQILTDPDLTRTIDLSLPVAILCVAVLHFVSDDDPARIVAQLRDGIAPGSFLAVSAATSTGTDPSVIAAIEEAYADASAPWSAVRPSKFVPATPEWIRCHPDSSTSPSGQPAGPPKPTYAFSPPSRGSADLDSTDRTPEEGIEEWADTAVAATATANPATARTRRAAATAAVTRPTTTRPTASRSRRKAI